MSRPAESATALPERNLDVLRAVAVTCVLVFHTLIVAFGMRETPLLQWLGQAGVCAFFVHTSLVLMSSLERDHAPARAHWVRRFYVRRAFRIYPLAWVIVLFVAASQRLPDGASPVPRVGVTTTSLAANLALVEDLAGQPHYLQVLWTLPLELQMYVMLPLCFLVARARSARGIATLVAAGTLLMTLAQWGPVRHVPGVSRLHVLAFVPCFLMGVLAYWLLRRRQAAGVPLRMLPAWCWPLIVLGAIAAFAVPFATWSTYWIARALYCAVFGVSIAYVHDARASLLTRGAHVVAKYSYGIYLIHPIALRTGFWVLRDQPLAVRWLAFVAILVGACWAAYHFIERPGIALGQRLVAHRRGGAAVRDPMSAAAAPPP